MTIFGSAIGALAAIAALALIYFGWLKLKSAGEGQSDVKLRAYLMMAAGGVTLLNLFMFLTTPMPGQ